MHTPVSLLFISRNLDVFDLPETLIKVKRLLKLEVKFENEKIMGCVRVFCDKNYLKTLLLL